MSQYSGKCDVADWISGMEKRDPDFAKKINLYAGDSDHKAKVPVERPEDIVPYYPFIVGMGCGERDGKTSMWIGSKSYITEEEESYFKWKKAGLVKYRNKCKRNKVAYDVEEALDNVSIGFGNDTEPYREELRPLAVAVGEVGNKASYEGMRRTTGMTNYYRKEWKQALIEAGWNEEDADKWIMEH